MVRVILVETTRPVRIRPRMETSPVNGHFLSERTRQHTNALILGIRARGGETRTDVSAVDRLGRRLEAQANILVPPLLLSRDLLGACVQSEPTVNTATRTVLHARAPRDFAFWKRNCFWYAFSTCRHEPHEIHSSSRVSEYALDDRPWLVILDGEAIGFGDRRPCRSLRLSGLVATWGLGASHRAVKLYSLAKSDHIPRPLCLDPSVTLASRNFQKVTVSSTQPFCQSCSTVCI